MSAEAEILDAEKNYTDQEIKLFDVPTFYKVIKIFDEKIKKDPYNLTILYEKANFCVVWCYSENCSPEYRKTALNLALDCITACTYIDMLDAEVWRVKAKILSKLGLPDERDDCDSIALDIISGSSQKRARAEKKSKECRNALKDFKNDKKVKEVHGQKLRRTDSHFFGHNPKAFHWSESILNGMASKPNQIPKFVLK